MTGKDKFIYILLSIITFGIYPMMVHKKAKQAPSDRLQAAEKVTLNVGALITALGEPSNIAGAEYTYTKVKVYLNDRSLVDVESVKSIRGISGVVAGSKYITVIVGRQAKALCEEILAEEL